MGLVKTAFLRPSKDHDLYFFAGSVDGSLKSSWPATNNSYIVEIFRHLKDLLYTFLEVGFRHGTND